MRNLILILLILASNTKHGLGKETVMVEMRDGVKLATDIYSPEENLNGHAILIRTPYDKNGLDVIASNFIKSGFHVVIQNVRGKYGSEGNFVPFFNEKKDGETTIDWLVKQEWLTGNIGLWGSSYLGYCALHLSNYRSDIIKGIVNISGWIDGEAVNFQGSAFHQGLVIPWLIFEGQQTKANIKNLDFNQILSYVPTKDVLPNMYFKLEEGDSIHLSEAASLSEEFEYNSSAQILHITGWYDFVSKGTISAFNSFVSRSNSNQHLILGPWYHNQFYDGNKYVGEYQLPKNGQITIQELLNKSIEWFNLTLNTKKIEVKKVRYYSLFQDTWKAAEQWPPKKTTKAEFYLNNEKLLKRINNRVSKSNFLYDPNHPCPTSGGANFNFFMDEMGIRNQKEIESRPDVLTFTSETVTKSTVFSGSVLAEIFLESEAKSTDLTAKLTLINDKGESYSLVDGIVRIHEVKKGVNKVNIDLGYISFEVKKGESIRLQISSSNFPKFGRNPNTGIDPIEAENFIPVKQTIYSGQKYPSKIILYEEL